MPTEIQAATEGGLASTRVFFALWPEPALARQLAGMAEALASAWGGKPTRQETIHLTLAFLGAVPDSRLPELRALPLPQNALPFTLTLDRLACWPRQRLIWLGCEESPPLLALLAGLRTQLAAANFALAEPERPFIPHVSLVRKLAPASRPDLPDPIARLAWPCAGYRLVASRLTSAGPDYRTLAEYRFGV